MLIDLLLVSLAILYAYLLRFDFKIPEQYISQIPYIIVSFGLIVIVSNYCFGIYKRMWRYASIGELISLFKVAGISTGAFFILYTGYKFLVDPVVIPRSIFLISFGLLILLVGGSRLAWRMWRDSYIKIQPHHRRALIVGAGNAGTFVARELKHNPGGSFYPIAFVDDDDTKHHLEVMGLPVLGSRKDIPNIVKNYDIDDIIIAIPSAKRKEVRKIFDIGKETSAKVKILPKVADLIEGKVSIQKIRDVKVEDLLGRDPVQVDLEGIMGYVTAKRVLVTGAGGSIGSELCRQVSQFNPELLILLGHGENSIYQIEMELRRTYPHLDILPIIADVQDKDRIDEVYKTLQPEVVFHAAAHKHVPLMERNPVEAVKNNIIGTKNVAECASKYGTERFVLISTDKAVNPTSVMGATKRVAELIVESLNETSFTKFTAVRFGNVLGSRGSVIPLFKRQIEQGGPVSVTHPEMVRYFMTIPEAVQLVIQAGALTKGGEVFILDMGEPVKILDLAQDLIRLSGFTPDEDIKIKFSGIRPGEKLYEEILTKEEGATSTKHDRIFIGKTANWTSKEMEKEIQQLQSVLHKSPVDIKKALRQIVPTFKEHVS
ncbi:nucleoside-diphosphate sugar epimerase/dehydratase [Caldalkalibacillus salinus]|uniref:nucleoside-diphosphate sugar epimerase/dehydratase n=1 Tax=Caldalkalibacillus salinus TaxID=2803787 RepID=UPI0019250453|nr:nucleoside-diphosphate sugar epimerase/dehydratase [Caldalkalibacillus salinus]